MGEHEGQFFYCNADEYDRKWEGPFNTRAEAVVAAEESELDHFETFYAKRRSALDFTPDADWLLERYLDSLSDEYAEQVIGDLDATFSGLTQDDKDDLTQRMRDALGGWFDDQGLMPDLYTEKDLLEHGAVQQ